MPGNSGSPTGSGNPPGKHSSSYVKTTKGGGSHFINNPSYRGDMHVGGIKESAPVVGNQPKQRKTSTLESRAKKENPIRKA